MNTLLKLSLLALLVASLYGCADIKQVKIIETNRNHTTWDTAGNYSLVERMDTHQRFFISGVYGQPGELVTININQFN